MNRDLLRLAASTSLLTLASRLLGFLRDALIAHALGAGTAAEAFVVAFRLPNVFRRLLAEGVLAQGLVPPLVGAATRSGAHAAGRLLARWLHHATAIGVALMLAGPVLAPPLIAWLAPGLGLGVSPEHTRGPDPRPLASELLLAMWPYLALSGITAVLAAGLNARGWFRAVACAPLMLNLALLAAFVVVPAADAVERAHALAGAVACGAVLQAGWLGMAIWRRRRQGGWARTLPEPDAPWVATSAMPDEPTGSPRRSVEEVAGQGHLTATDVGQEGRQCTQGAARVVAPNEPDDAMPAAVPSRMTRRGRARLLVSVLNASVGQINLLVAMVVASSLLPGSLAWLYLAERLVEFPLGLIAGGLATVLLPRLAAAEAGGATHQWSASVDTAVEVTWLVALPAAVGLTVLATPVVATLFQHGALSPADALAAAGALAALGPGVLPLCIARVLLPAALSRVPTRRLLALGALLPLVHLTLLLPLAGLWGHIGVAFAASLTGLVQALVLLVLLAATGYLPLAGRRLAALGRPLVASVVVSLLLLWLLPPAEEWFAAGHGWRALMLLGSVAGCLSAYVASLLLLGWRPALSHSIPPPLATPP